MRVTRPDPGPDGIVGTADDGGLFTFYDYDPTYRGSQFVATTYVNATDRDQYWHNVELQLQKRQADNWFATTSVLLTKNHRWLAPYVETPNDVDFRLDDNWTWQYRAAAGVTLPKGIQVSTITQVDIGPYGQRTVVFSSPTSGTLTLPVEPYGASQGPTRTIVNLRGLKNFEIGSGRFGVQADVFNLFNTNVSWVQSWVSGSRFGAGSEFADPRVLRLGVTYEF